MGCEEWQLIIIQKFVTHRVFLSPFITGIYMFLYIFNLRGEKIRQKRKRRRRKVYDLVQKL